MARLNIEGHLHRFEGNSKHRALFWVRSYARIETAVSRGITFLILEGQPGDLLEFVLKLNGDQVAFLKYTATGKVLVHWNDTEAKRLKAEQLFGSL